MNGFRKIFPIFSSHYATFFTKMAERKVVPFDEFYYQLKLMHLFQKHPVYLIFTLKNVFLSNIYTIALLSFTNTYIKILKIAKHRSFRLLS
jgi:hypothetical protein